MNGVLLTSIAFLWPLLALLGVSYTVVTLIVMGMAMPQFSRKNDALEDSGAELGN